LKATRPSTFGHRFAKTGGFFMSIAVHRPDKAKIAGVCIMAALFRGSRLRICNEKSLAKTITTNQRPV